MDNKKSTGPNARPKNGTIARSGEGLSDDSSDLPEGAKDADEEKARGTLDRLGHDQNEVDTTEE